MLSIVSIAAQAGAKISRGRNMHSVALRQCNRLLRSFPVMKNEYLIFPQNHVILRYFAAMSESDLKKRLDEFQDLFVEARLTIEDCTDAAGTNYFDEEAEAAQEAVDEAVEAFENVIKDIDDDEQKNRVLRGNGLKVEQLKGELQMALHAGHDH